MRTLAEKGGTVDEVKRIMTATRIRNLADTDLDLFLSSEGHGGNFLYPVDVRGFLGISEDDPDSPYCKPRISPAAAPPVQPSVTEARRTGGRPPAFSWEDAIIDVCRRIYEGEFQPRSQADVTRALQDWFGERDQHPSDSAVKERSRKIFRALGHDR